MSTPLHLHSAIDRPSPWVKRFAPLVPEGEILDLACGSGRHARLFASLGHPVLAVDRDSGALETAAGASITPLQIDLEQGEAAPIWPFEQNRFAGIVVTNYLHRPLLPHLYASLAPQGILIYETFAQGNGLFGKPSNPDFLLLPGELLEFALRMGTEARVLAFEDGYIEEPKPAMVQRICLAKQIAASPPERMKLF